jgi:hypothetical protein
LSIGITRAVTFGTALALLGTFAVIVLSVTNQSLRQDVAERQQTINQGLGLSQVNTRLINSLAAIAARDNDDQIRILLANQGITFKAGAGQGALNPVPEAQLRPAPKK